MPHTVRIPLPMSMKNIQFPTVSIDRVFEKEGCVTTTNCSWESTNKAYAKTRKAAMKAAEAIQVSIWKGKKMDCQAA